MKNKKTEQTQAPYVTNQMARLIRVLSNGDPKSILAWEIYWRIRSWETNHKKCYEKPQSMFTDMGVPERTFFNAVDYGESNLMFCRIGKAKSHLGRQWHTLLRIEGFNDENHPIISFCVPETEPTLEVPGTSRPATIHTAQPSSQHCSAKQSHVLNCIY